MVKAYLFILFLQALYLVPGSKLVEYRFGVNFGQVFYDYSENSLYGINGVSSTNLTSDTLATDRGAYFVEGTEVVTFPPNDKSSINFLLPSQYSIIFWANIYASTGRTDYLYYSKAADGNHVYLTLTSSTIQMQVRINGYTETSSQFQFSMNTWCLLVFVFDLTTASLVVNNSVLGLVNIVPQDFSETMQRNRSLGGNGSSFGGFLWYTSILDDVTSYPTYMAASSSVCLTTSCTSPCYPAFVDPYKGKGCISTASLSTQNANKVNCPVLSPVAGCFKQVSLVCSSCSFASCSFSINSDNTAGENQSGVTCITCSTTCATCTSFGVCSTCTASNASPDSAGVCVCKTGYYASGALNTAGACVICNTECSSFTSSNSCATCKASNAGPGGSGCVCDPGYWGTAPLTSANSCVNCYEECSSCIQASVCTSCIALNALHSITQGCTCETGYWGNAPLIESTSCSPCNSECSQCTQADACTACIASNATPDINSGVGCVCMTGYSGAHPLNTANSCVSDVLCMSECTACTQPDICTACVASYAVPSVNSGDCVCKDGYWGTSPLVLANSCLPCNADCSSCSGGDVCITCKDSNAVPDTLTNIGCRCAEGYWKSGNLCRNCDGSCASCSGGYDYECTSCNSTYFYGFCLDRCPLGYVGDTGNCTLSESPLALQFNFDSTGSVYYDRVNGIPALLENATRSRALTSTIYKRGMYFDGNGYLRMNTSEAILGPQFSLALWINCNIADGMIVYKGNLTSQVFSVSLNSSRISGNLTTNNTKLFYSSLDTITHEMWNHAFITIDYSEYTTVQVALNGLSNPMLGLAGVPFVDTAIFALFFAYDPNALVAYTGFLYQLELFIPTISISSIITSGCGTCSLCPAGGICIPNCGLGLYYSEASNECLACPSSCSNNCVNSTSCTLCLDANCISCYSFSNTNSCTDCDVGYVLHNSACAVCPSSYFYNRNTKSCTQCQDLCLECNSTSRCVICVENSYLQANYACACDKGYSGSVVCERNMFTATLSVFQNNTIKLIFSEPVYTILDSSIIQVKVSDISYAFTIYPLDPEDYLISLTNFTVISGSASLLVIFSKSILSVNNSLLSTSSLQSKLLVDSITEAEIAIQAEAAAAKGMAATSTTIGMSAVLGISILNFDPTSFCNFMNTAELFYSAYLFNMEIYPVFSEFLLGMRIESSLPNVFSYFISENKGSQMPEKYSAYGYKTNLLLLNGGVRFSVLLIFLIGGLLLVILKTSQKLEQFLKPLINMFKYGVFMRFWVQLFFELLVASILGLGHYNFSTAIQYIDLLITTLLFVISI